MRAIGLGIYETYFWVKMTLLSVVKIFQGSVSARDLGGPILIVQAAGQQAERGLDRRDPGLSRRPIDRQAAPADAPGAGPHVEVATGRWLLGSWFYRCDP